ARQLVRPRQPHPRPYRLAVWQQHLRELSRRPPERHHLALRGSKDGCLSLSFARARPARHQTEQQRPLRLRRLSDSQRRESDPHPPHEPLHLSQRKKGKRRYPTPLRGRARLWHQHQQHGRRPLQRRRHGPPPPRRWLLRLHRRQRPLVQRTSVAYRRLLELGIPNLRRQMDQPGQVRDSNLGLVEWAVGLFRRRTGGPRFPDRNLQSIPSESNVHFSKGVNDERSISKFTPSALSITEPAAINPSLIFTAANPSLCSP